MHYSTDALRRRPGRTALTALGIGLATALVLVLLSVSAGIQTSAYRLATSSGVDLLGTSANTSLSSTSFPPLIGAHGLARAVPEADPNVATASPWLVSSLVFANASLFAASNLSANGSSVPAGWQPASASSIGWIPSDNGGLEVPAIVAGSNLPATGDPHYANGSYQGPSSGAVVLNTALARLLHVTPNATIWASAQSPSGPAALGSWFAHASSFRVVGVSGPFWFLPSVSLGMFYLSELQQLVGGASASTDYASLVLIHLTDPTLAGQDQTLLSAKFPAITFFTLGNVLGAIQRVVDLYRTFGTIIGLIGILVATLFTATVLLMSVEDRSRELALLRAVGFSRAQVGWFVVQEGLLLAALGLAAGLPLGLLGATLLNDSLERLVSGLPTGFSFVAFNGSVLAEGLAEVMLIGLVASLIPLVRALRIPVAEELRAA
ncbi:MAG: FtsX-like permease family protein [Thermoplasmata archaeon]|nr:FtsX-like permease family protein [Thermoplasmata archaeon]